MTRYHGHETVDPGLYFEPHGLVFRSVDRREPLPGGATGRWYRVPTLLLVVVGPLLGLVYVVFLPFIGFAMVAALLAEKLGRLARRAGARLVRAARKARPLRETPAAGVSRLRTLPPRGAGREGPRPAPRRTAQGGGAEKRAA